MLGKAAMLRTLQGIHHDVLLPTCHRVQWSRQLHDPKTADKRGHNATLKLVRKVVSFAHPWLLVEVDNRVICIANLAHTNCSEKVNDTDATAIGRAAP